MSAAGAGNSGLGAAAKRESSAVINTAKDMAQEAPGKMKAAAEESQSAAQRIFQKPVMKAALPFINGGIAGWYSQPRP